MSQVTKYRVAYGVIGGPTLGYYAGERQGSVADPDDETVVVYETEAEAAADAAAFNAQQYRATQGHEFRVEPTRG